VATPAVDLAPPWARFPTYERYTIGWRMGAGEDYLVRWWAFVTTLPADEASRRAYLRRHPPAPFTWAERVAQVLRPRAADDGDGDGDDDGSDVEAAHARRIALAADGLIAEDVAYRTWRATQAELAWPWAWVDTPVYRRDLLRAGNDIAGPALIEEHASTTVVQPGDTLRVDELGNLQITIGSDRS
jgi:hypothetical protein